MLTINKFQRDMDIGGRCTPEELAERYEVPLIPKLLPRKKIEENPVVAVYRECGYLWRTMIFYLCKKSNCPCKTRIKL